MVLSMSRSRPFRSHAARFLQPPAAAAAVAPPVGGLPTVLPTPVLPVAAPGLFPPGRLPADALDASVTTSTQHYNLKSED